MSFLKGTKIPVTFLPGETFEMRTAAAKRVSELGFPAHPAHLRASPLFAGRAGGLPLAPAASAPTTRSSSPATRRSP